MASDPRDYLISPPQKDYYTKQEADNMFMGNLDRDFIWEAIDNMQKDYHDHTQYTYSNFVTKGDLFRYVDTADFVYYMSQMQNEIKDLKAQLATFQNSNLPKSGSRFR